MDPVYCKNCARLYDNFTDQCNIPACGLDHAVNNLEKRSKFAEAAGLPVVPPNLSVVDEEGAAFLTTHLKHIIFSRDTTEVFGYPTELNVNHDCYFFKPQDKDPWIATELEPGYGAPLKAEAKPKQKIPWYRKLHL